MIWREGALQTFPDPGDEPFAWLTRLDDPAVKALADAAPLRAADLADFASRPQADMRGMRRRLAKLLLARLAGVHPDAVAVGRTRGGAPRVDTPEGWHLSVAGRWPLCLIGVSRRPLGVDVESADALPPPDDALTPEERAELTDAPPGEHVARWTAKEAHAKLFGVAAQADAAAIGTAAAGAGLADITSPAGRSRCHLLRAQGALAAVATLAS